jgi:hypothetical protein
MGQGYYVNWQKATASVLQNPLYIRFQNLNLGDIDPAVPKGLLGSVKPTTENAEIISYLSWIIRCQALAGIQ